MAFELNYMETIETKILDEKTPAEIALAEVIAKRDYFDEELNYMLPFSRFVKDSESKGLKCPYIQFFHPSNGEYNGV